MPKNWIHCALSKKRTGKNYKELHKWIDEDKEDLGVEHRSARHHYTRALRNHVHKNFGGDEAVSEWLFHIALDNLDTSVTNDWNWNNVHANFHEFGFSNSGYIHYSREKLSENELEEEFSDEED